MISFEAENELRSEAMMMKSESLSPISSRTSSFADSESDAASEAGRGVLKDGNIASEADNIREDIALQLATQLYSFQGCTEEQHEAQDQQHRLHQQADANHHCASLADILPIIEGRGIDGATLPLPDVLSQRGIMEAQDLPEESCCNAFEGMGPLPLDQSERTSSAGSHCPRNLCFSANYIQNQLGHSPEVTFDIDSICGEVDSLAFARLGLQWIPKSFPALNIEKDIHLTLRTSYTTKNGRVSSRYMPLNKIAHYCCGQVEGMEYLKVYICFPNLRSSIDYDHTSFLTDSEDEDWLNLIIAPSLREVVTSQSVLQYLPLSSAAVGAASLASSHEAFRRKSSSRRQIISHTIQPEYLDRLWSAILRRIDSTPGCRRFSQPVIFVNAKNTKLKQMRDSPPQIYTQWLERWNYVTDDRFYRRQKVYIDIGKQTITRSPLGPNAEVFLNRKCCAETYFQRRSQHITDTTGKEHGLKRTVYQWAGLRDVVDHTIVPVPSRSTEVGEHPYTQFYSLTKVPGDAAGAYLFQNQALENLALDPEYVNSLKREGSATSFSWTVCMNSYLYSKDRARIIFTEGRERSYGCREEHRASMAVMDKVCEHWLQWEQDSSLGPSRDRPPPYFVVPSRDLFSFLYAQVNKYCFLFEHVLSHSNKTLSLSETAVMIVALRALRHCYGSSLTVVQPVLFKNQWEQKKGVVKSTLREGLGMDSTMERYGIAWFLPKINWAVTRFKRVHQANLIQGSMLLHREYRRRWRAVRDLRSVFVRLSQADAWFDQYDLAQDQPLRTKWLEYLLVLNIEQFDSDIWKTVLKMDRSRPELTPGMADQLPNLRFCFEDMRAMCKVQGEVGPPHIVTGNKSRFKNGFELLSYLFSWNDGHERMGWDAEPYRMIYRKIAALIGRRLGQEDAQQWSDQFFHVLQLTHWVLPYPGPYSIMQHTKSRMNRGVQARMMWFSATYQPSGAPPHWPEDRPYNLRQIVEICNLTSFGDASSQDGWEVRQLISVYSAQGLTAANCAKGWVLNPLRHSSTKSAQSCWEESHRPPHLKLLEQVKGKSLEELDELMLQFQRDIRDTSETPLESRIVTAQSQGHDNSDIASILSDANSGSVWEP
jgi:hypothetical protein